MKKYWSFMVLSICALSVPFVYQNCSPASFQYNPSSDSGLVLSESANATSTSTQLDEAMFQQICIRLGGTYNALATSDSEKCKLNLMSANDMANINSRFCQEVLNGVWDPTKVPACALPFVNQQVFDQAKQDLQAQIDQLKGQVGQIDTLNAKLDDLQNQLKNVPTKSELDALKLQITSLQAQFDSIDLSQFVKKDEFQTALNSINTQISDLQSQITQLSNSTTLNTQAIAALNSRVDGLQNQINNLMSDYSALVVKFDELSKLVAESQADINNLKQNSVTKDELATLKTELMEFINNLKTRVDQLYAMDLVSQAKLNEVLAPIISSYQLLAAEIDKLKESSVTQEQLNAAVTAINNKYNELQMALQTLSGEVANHSILISDLKTNMTDLNKIVEDLKANSVTKEELKQVVAGLNQEISNLIMQINAINEGQSQQNKEIQDILASLTDLRSLIEKNALSIEGLKKIIAELDSRVTDIDRQLLVILADLKNVSDQTTANTQMLASLQSAINSLELRVKNILENGVTKDELRSSIASLRQDIDLILAKLVVLQSADDKNEKLIAQLMSQISQLNQVIIKININSVTNYRDVIKKFAGLITGWSIKITDYINSISSLDDDLDQFYSAFGNNGDQQICESLGGTYDATATEKCKLNVFNMMTLQKRVKMACLNSAGAETLEVKCPDDFKLVACSGRGGIETNGMLKGTITPDFVNKRCVLKVDKPSCTMADKATHQRVVAVCAKMSAGSYCNVCPKGTVWNSHIKKCEVKTCPTNYKLEGDKCMPLVPICPPGSSYDPQTKKCYSNPQYCPQGYTYDFTKKVCIKSN